jgi:SPP1 gp7 family putative phage head morphogenesis protein
MKRSEWTRARRAETSYGAKLRKVARHIADIISGFDPFDFVAIRRALDHYAELITPWAASVGRSMFAEVASRDRKAWWAASRDISRNLHHEVDRMPTGEVMRHTVESQVGLIKSMPLEAAQRVQKLALEASISGTRPESLVNEIRRTGAVTRARANVIARTEVGRATTALTASRAQFVGSTHFVWRTMKDSVVRESHRVLEGKSFAWDDPPECDPGIWALPGSSPNCRCFAEPVIPED